MVDRCCSPVWSSDAPVFPASAGAPCSEGFGASPPGSRDITALEQSLLDHIEALFAQRNSLQEDLGRIRREMEDPCMDSVSFALEKGPGEPKDTTEAKRKRTRRRRRRSHMGGSTRPPPSPLEEGGATSSPCAGTVAVTPVSGDGPWSRVLGRRAGRAARAATVSSSGPSVCPGHGVALGLGRGARGVGTADLLPGRSDPFDDRKVRGRRESGPRLRPPTTAVVSVTLEPGTELGYRDVMAEARSRIDLEALGIANSRIRQAVNGGVLIQIRGKDRVKLADVLADKMDEVLKGKGVRIGRPSKFAELRIRGVDVSVTPDDITAAIALLGGCSRSEVRVGRVRETNSGLCTAWVRCPALAAKRMSSVGSVRLGWGFASIELLRPRPLRFSRL